MSSIFKAIFVISQRLKSTPDKLSLTRAFDTDVCVCVCLQLNAVLTVPAENVKNRSKRFYESLAPKSGFQSEIKAALRS